MRDEIARGAQIIRGDGIHTLLQDARTYAINQSDFLDSIQYKYYRWNGSIRVSIGKSSAKFNISDRADYRALTYFKKAEAEMARDIVCELKPDDVVWDVGANFGIYTCLIEAAPIGSAIAFEPLSENICRLNKNLQLNNLDSTVVDVALWNSNSEVGFGRVASGDLGGASVHANGGSETVQTRRGDNLDIPSPSIVKIDVEGAEQNVIDGLERRLSEPKCRLVYCELHHSEEGSSICDYGSTPGTLKQTFSDLGFEVQILEQRPGQTHLKAVKK